MRKHKSIPLETRKQIVEYGGSLNLAQPENVSPPTVKIESIEGLEIFSDWRCQEQCENDEIEKCKECCTTETSMEKHCRDVHG